MKKMFVLIIDLCERTFFQSQQQQQQSGAFSSGGTQWSAPADSGGHGAPMQVIDIFDEKIYQLPSFIESLACVCSQIDEPLPDGSVQVIEKLIVLAIDSYPKLVKRYNHQLSLAVARLFIAIQLGGGGGSSGGGAGSVSKANVYGEFIARIIYQCMIRTFSYKTNYAF